MRRQEAGPNNSKYVPNPKGDAGKYAGAGSAGGFRRTGESVGALGSKDKAVAARGFTPTDGAKETSERKISDE